MTAEANAHGNAHRRTPPARTPGPTGVFDRIARRVPALKAMALTPIGDIANPSLTQNLSETITWETATDWNNYTSQSGVEHETQRDETSVRLGHQNTDQSPKLFARFYSGSGSTVQDVSGNNLDGTINGNINWTSAPSPRFAGALTAQNASLGDDVNFGSIFTGGNSYHEFECWFYPRQTGNQKIMEQEDAWTMFYDRNGGQKLNFATFGASSDIGPSLATGTWHHAYFRWEVSNQYFAYINGSQYTASVSDGEDVMSNDMGLFDDPNADNLFTGDIAEARAWTGNSIAVNSVADTLYVTSGSLTSATKSFSASTAPDLTNLSYSLNGESITIDVIGSPGTASEEIVSQTLDGASSYTLSWSNSHTDFRVRLEPSTATATTSPQVNAVSLVTP